MDNLFDLTEEQRNIIDRIKGYSIFVMTKYPKSRKKLKVKILQSKNYETYLKLFDNDDYIDKILGHLEDIGIINDHILTMGRVRNRFSSGWGFNKILINVPNTLGVSVDEVKNCIEILKEESININSDGCETDVEIDSILKYLRIRVKGDDLTDHKSKQRLYRRLLSRGFSYDKINKSIDLFKNENKGR